MTTWTKEQVTEYLTRVRDDLRSGKISDEHFSMMDIITSCGTAGCIGGWVLIYRAVDDDVPLDLAEACCARGLSELVDAFPSGDEHDCIYNLFFFFPRERMLTAAEGANAIDAWLDGRGSPWKDA